MRKTFRKVLATLLTAGLAIGMMAAPAAAESAEGTPLKICIITSSGVDDGSFNQDCYNGIKTFLETHDDCSVTDIKESDLAKVKTKFYKANHTRRGSGIGLAVADEIITMHGGTMDIASEGEDKGTTVTISLPAKRSSALQ